MTQPSKNVNDRAVSPAVGTILIIGFVVIVGLGLFLFGGSLLQSADDPRVDARFSVDVENQNQIEVLYSEGEEFTSDDTERLYAVGENATGDDIGNITLYDGIRTSSTGKATLKSNTVVINATKARNAGIGPGTSLKIVWIPEDDQDTEIVLDEVVIPDKSDIFVVQDASGSIHGFANVSTGGNNPRN